MDKTAIKNFAIWARKKLIGDISYKANLMGITTEGIKAALPQSTKEIEFYDIGLQEPFSISGKEIAQRCHLAELIRQREKDSGYDTAYRSVMEEVAYTWFNRLIAIRFMEVNDYLPSHTRILSSDSQTKLEPDIITNPFDTELSFTEAEKEQIIQWQHENAMDSLFMLLFIKACNTLNELLPQLFEKTSNYTELLLNLSVTDREGVVYRLVHDIPEEDFNVEQGGQVEIIGWLYQYYNTELKDETFALLKKNVKITKERIPSATQLFTPHWIVQYMVENSLGRLWVEGHPNEELKANWKYYLEEAEQEPEVQKQLAEIRKEYVGLTPEDIRCMDPCMGSGHILVYMFDVLMQIYTACGYATRDAAVSIVEHNLWGLDIDERAAQLAYFSVMMKGRQYDRRFLSRGIKPHVYAIHESNALGGAYQYDMGDFLLSKEHQETLNYLLDVFVDAKEYGSILQLEDRDYTGLKEAWESTANSTADTVNLSLWQYAVAPEIPYLIEQAIALTQKYHVVVTNPPYMSNKGMNPKLSFYVQDYYPTGKTDMYAVFMNVCRMRSETIGLCAIITQHSWMFLSSQAELRDKMLRLRLLNMAHLGSKAFEEISGEVVQTTSFVWAINTIPNYKGIYIKLTDDNGEEEKRRAFLSKLKRYVISSDIFLKINGTPVAYWLSEKALSILKTNIVLDKVLTTRAGMITGDNNLFVRFWFEVALTRSSYQCKSREEALLSQKKWFPYSKGGEHRKWYGNNDCVVNWFNDGFEMRNRKDEQGNIPAHAFNLEYIFKTNICWNSLSSKKFSARYTSKGYLYDAGGSFASVTLDRAKYFLGYLNSNIAFYYLTALNPTMNFQKGNVGNLPICDASKIQKEQIDNLVTNCLEFSKEDWDKFEYSWDFQSHPLIPLAVERKEQLSAGMLSKEQKKSVSLLSYRFNRWKQECNQRFAQLKENEEELNRIFIDIYGLQDELTPDVEDKDVTVRKADLQRDIRSLISYAVGCMFGRYSIDRSGLAYAGGEWDYESYITFKPDEDNVVPITDEEYFDDDIVGVFCKWLEVVYGKDTLEENLDFIARALGNSGTTSREIIRNYFLKDFYKDHCKIYQKRPIYWLFDSGKQNGFKALIYLHRYDKDTIGNMRAEYLHRMEHVYESEINRMNALAEQTDNQREAAKAVKRAEKLQKQLKECKEYDEKVGHLAVDRIELDLDDGVKVNYEKVQTDRNGNKYPILAKI